MEDDKKITASFQSVVQTRLKSYAPYSEFAAGAAVQCKSGEVFVGANVENLFFGLSICTERVALSTVVGAGQREFDAIAIVPDSIEAIAPCGARRQFMAEFASDLFIVSATLKGGGRPEHLSELLPYPKRGILESKNVHVS